MTISSAGIFLTFAGDDVTTAFNLTGLHFFKAADLKVYIRAAAGTVTLQTITTHYTVTGTDTTSGIVTMVTAPATGETLVVIRDPAALQETDYPADGKFPSEAHEDALDLLTELAQYLLYRSDRSVRFEDGTAGGTGAIPGGTVSKFLFLDSNGNLTVTSATGTSWHVTAVDPPDASLGIDGDLAVVSGDGDVFSKSGGAWSATGLNLKGPAGGMSAATYDPAGIAEQLVGLTAAQTLTNKSLTSPTITGTAVLTGAAVTAGTFNSPTIATPTISAAVLNGALTGDAIAAQAEMETATAVDSIVTPGRQHFHPSALKAWVNVSDSAGTPTIDASYNVASLTDTDVGKVTINIDTDMSSAQYSIVGMSENGRGTVIAAVVAAGTIEVWHRDTDTAAFLDSGFSVQIAGDL